MLKMLTWLDLIGYLGKLEVPEYLKIGKVSI